MTRVRVSTKGLCGTCRRKVQLSAFISERQALRQKAQANNLIPFMRLS